MPARSLQPLLLSGLALLLAAAMDLAAAASPGSDAAACPSDGDGRARLDCLGTALKASDVDLERSLAAARAAIGARGDLAEPQRQRWLGLVEEAQGRFVHWRDFECQSIAPYESGEEATVGGRRVGIGSLAERMLCLIRSNTHRAADLGHRYKAPPGWTYQPQEPPTAPPPAVYGAPRIIAP